MKKAKSIQTLDRLSELQDSLIQSIFEFLPMKDVVATTVLSTRWRNLWTTTPYLNFAEFGSGDAEFITSTLMFWRGTKILKLKLDSSFTFAPYQYRHIDLWLRFAKDHEVEELFLVAPAFNEEKYPVPQYLFTACPSLQVLTLVACNLNQIKRNVQWNKLKSLDIYSEDGFTHDTINRILLGSPQLESLVMKFMDADEDLTIRSTSLKTLLIERRIWTDEPVPQTRLIIYAPSLETFKIRYAPYKYCSLENVSSLSHISLRFDDDWEDLIHQQMKHILPLIQRVESVSLSDCCVKVLLSLRNKHLAPRLFYAKFLKLTSSFSDHKLTADALAIFPNLETLVLEDVNVFEKESETVNYFNFQPSLPNLRRVEVEWGDFADDKRIFELIEILFRHARSLEMMEFRVMGNNWHPTPPEYFDLVVLERLRRMQRVSQTAKLVVSEFDIP